MSIPYIERSLAPIKKSDLRRLAKLASEDREDFFARHQRWRQLYSKRLLCVALCQGSALHYLDGKNGVKDFDVWTFFIEHLKAPFPYRRRGCADFGLSKFGRHPDDADYVGRRIDFIGRSLQCSLHADPIATIQSYLTKGSTQSAKLLAKKAVIGLAPESLFGVVIWSSASTNGKRINE